MYQDGLSETIAHFIGLFESYAEAARLRHGYDEFSAATQSPQLQALPEPQHLAPRQILQLAPNNPLIKYAPEVSQAHTIAATLPTSIDLMHMRMPEADWSPKLALLVQVLSPGSDAVAVPVVGPVPGSVGLIAAQYISVSDNDVIIFGSQAGPFFPYQPDTSPLGNMLAELRAFSAQLADLPAADIFYDIPGFIQTAVEAATNIANHHAPELSVFSASGTATRGTHVNGEQATQLPTLDDWLPKITAETGPATTGSVSLQTGDNSLIVAMGHNLLANEASIVDAGLAPAIVAVAGDYIRLDLISQANAYMDEDQVDAGFSWSDTDGTTASINVATFTTSALNAQSNAVAANPEIMPFNWTVSILQGDLVFLEWVSQYTFAADNDLLVMTATGSTTNISTGDNTTHNDISFAQLGLYYDIIIVGGSLYDANLICQTNVLYDNDTLQMLAGTDLEGSSPTSGNVLWNQASISAYGPHLANGGLPNHFANAIEGFDQGDLTMPKGWSNDLALAGFGHLRVLHITGNIYDLHSIQQTNVLTDADHLAVYANSAANFSGSNWTISTGQNALTNIASIEDYASTGNTLYVGGETYSDAVLIQADLVGASASHHPGLPGELVAFLDTEPAFQVMPDFYHAPTLHGDAAPADVMQSVLA